MKSILALFLLFIQVAHATYLPQTTLLQGNLQLAVTNPLPQRLSDGTSFYKALTDAELRASAVPVTVSSSSAIPVRPWESSANPSQDAFKIQRVSMPHELWSVSNIYDMSPMLVDNILVGGGGATFLPNEASIQMSVGIAAGDKVTRRSRNWIRYHPGSSHLIKITGLMGTPTANISTRIGYFDDQNGVFFQQTIAGLEVCRRTFTSGAIVNDCYPQASWNLDKLDGAGPSGKTVLDGSKDLIYIMDFQWLSYGRIRWGIDFGDKLVYVHEFNGVNNLTVPIFSTPHLPVTWQIENTAASVGGSMKAVCASVFSEGTKELEGYKYSVPSQSAAVAVTTRRPILSVRAKTIYAGVTNRVLFQALSTAAVNTASGNGYCEAVVGGTLTGASWTAVDATSAAEYDTTATAITGGTTIDSYGINGTSFTVMDLSTVKVFSLSADGTNSDIMSLVCTNLTGTTTLKGFVDWKEYK